MTSAPADRRSGALLQPPAPLDVMTVTSADGAEIVVRRHGNAEGPRIFLSHGNGFAIQGYYCFWRMLLDDFDVVLHDIRNHGQNPFHGPSGHNYDGFVQDWSAILRAVPERWGEKPTAGLHHSAAALTSLHHAHDVAWPWDALVVFDPPIVPGTGHPMRAEAQEFEGFMANFARNRPDRFSDPSELAEGFKANKGLAGWAPGTHELMARSILRRDEAGGDWVLACPREMEADLYASNAESTLWRKLPAVRPYRDRLLVVCGDPSLPWAKPPSKVGPLLPGEFGISQTYVPGTSHLLQLEEPEATMKIAREFLSSVGFG